MDQNLRYSASFELNAGKHTDQTLFALIDVDFVSINDDLTLAINQRTGAELMLMPPVAMSLRRCDRFLSLEQHAARLCGLFDELRGEEQDVLATLQAVAQHGILTSAEQITAVVGPIDAAPLAPTRVFVITCDRPAGLGRLLDSIRQTRGLEQHNAIVVVDDSRDTANAAKNMREVELFNQHSPRPAQYMGPREIGELLSVVLSALPAHADGIRFALDRNRFAGQATYGISRTVCQMMSVGYRAIVLDDDVLCQALYAPEAGTGMRFSAQSEAWHFNHIDNLFGAVSEAPFSPLQAHAGTVGTPLTYALKQWKQALHPAQLNQASAGLAAAMRSDSRILITQNGSMGDNGAGSAHWALNMDRATIERFLAAPGSLNDRFSSRSIWFGPRQPTIYKMARLSQISGIDNTACLPPYFPIYRGEDVLFGAMVEHMHPHHFVMGLPWAAPHLPLDDRSNRTLEGPVASLTPMHLFCCLLTESTDFRSDRSAEERLIGIAEGLRRATTTNDKELQARYRREGARVLADQLRTVEAQRQATADLQDDEWQRYLKRAGQDVFNAINAPGKSGHVLDEQALSEWRGHAKSFAATLDAWPKVRAVCQDLELG